MAGGVWRGGDMFGRNFVRLVCIGYFSLLCCGVIAAQAKTVTAREVVARIQQHVGVAWHAETVDTFKAGDPNTPVTGIAVTMMATLDVIERAAASGKNLVITHEPTFYGHLDQTEEFENENDAVFAAKKAFIAEHHMVI